jgi:hypothetical protein
MAQTHLRLAVLARSRAPVSRWAERGFVPLSVSLAPPDAAPGSRLGPAGDDETWYAGEHDLRLHSGDTGHYRDNLASGRPALWVALRRGGLAIVALTADPYEGEALAGDDGLAVAAVAMPGPVAATVAAFTALHHVEQAFEKRKRKRADPEALARRGIGDPRGRG